MSLKKMDKIIQDLRKFYFKIRGKYNNKMKKIIMIMVLLYKKIKRGRFIVKMKMNLKFMKKRKSEEKKKVLSGELNLIK